MDRYFIVIRNAGRGKMQFFVVSPSIDQYDGKHIGNLFVAGNLEGEFDALQDAVEFIRNN